MDLFTIRCSSCRAKNRIPKDKSGEKARCGKCKAPLDTSVLSTAVPVKVTDATFTENVMNSPLPVLLDCWAPWCGPCRMTGPVMDKLAKEWKGRIRIAKLNVDENPKTAAKFQTRSIPAFLVFDGGKHVDTFVGALPENQFKKKMARFL